MRIILKSDLNFINRSKVYMMPGGGFSLDKGGKVEFDTYFNGFSIEKWRKYTQVKEVSINLELQGDVLVITSSQAFPFTGESLKKELVSRKCIQQREALIHSHSAMKKKACSTLK